MNRLSKKYGKELTAEETSGEYIGVGTFDFEFIKIPVCSGYDHYLKNEFGNYWEYVIGTSMHNELFFDTNNSYREYVKNK